MEPSSGSGNTAHTANDSLATTNLLTPQSFYSGIGRNAGIPMAASARVVHPTSTGSRQPTVAELKKTQSKLPSLHFNSKVPFQLVKTWKEWTNLVQLTMSNWNEQAPLYWKNTVDRATTLYGQYCAMDSDSKAAVETTDQL
eukprot:5716305-Amphidinium_carterae.1